MIEFMIAVILHMQAAQVDADEQARYEQLALMAETRAEAAEVESKTWYEPEPYWEPYPVLTTDTGDYSAYSQPNDGLNAFTGVNYHDGRTETYYSSNVLYHYRTPEWSLDSEGFWRDSEGRYVVAASDMEQGTVFEGSKGECIVLDTGCAPGVTDYYVNWG